MNLLLTGRAALGLKPARHALHVISICAESLTELRWHQSVMIERRSNDQVKIGRWQ